MQDILTEKTDLNKWDNRFGGRTHIDHYGEVTFYWPSLPEVRQKPLDPGLAHRQDYFFGNGSHMPLIIFIQRNRNTHRQSETIKNRSRKRNTNWHTPAMEAEAQNKLKERGVRMLTKRGGQDHPRSRGLPNAIPSHSLETRWKAHKLLATQQ